jgi:hypothetical protein
LENLLDNFNTPTQKAQWQSNPLFAQPNQAPKNKGADETRMRV